MNKNNIIQWIESLENQAKESNKFFIQRNNLYLEKQNLIKYLEDKIKSLTEKIEKHNGTIKSTNYQILLAQCSMCKEILILVRDGK